MNRKELIEEIQVLDGDAKFEHTPKELKATIKGKTFIFRFAGHFDNEELIVAKYNGMIIFADAVKFKDGDLFLTQNGGVFVANITKECPDVLS